MDVRANLHGLMTATVADHANWTYAFRRPLSVPPSWKPGQHVDADCSWGVKLLCKWGGGPDPMGTNWATWGNSSTLCAHLEHLSSPSELQVGDVVTFGAGGDEHATMVMEAGADPLLWSHGHQGAPNTYRLSYDGREHQLLRNPIAAPVLTPADKLRAKTGYWAWVQWKLGEGAWHNYKPATKAVRPAVPKVIPLAWWKLYAKFLFNRKQGNKATTA